MIRHLLSFLRVGISLFAASGFFATPGLGQESEFDRDIAPLLARRCLQCHDQASQKGGLNLTSLQGLRSGGDSGPVVPTDAAGRAPEDSLLWQRVLNDEMPPDRSLTAAEKATLKRWIASGADWGSGSIDPFKFTTEARGGYDWWSLQPLAAVRVPATRDSRSAGDSESDNDIGWPRNEIDHFVWSRLESEGIRPAPSADSLTLLRRLYVRLIGMLPVLEPLDTVTSDSGLPTTRHVREHLLGLVIDLNTFSSDTGAYLEVVDRLLESPHYGERWARHWLDVIRFGESQGFERNRIRDNAWRYRDWVIDAFNNDLPYDEFVRQQIAGDVLYPDQLRPLLATGFLVAGTWDQVGHREGTREMQKAVRQDHLEDLVGSVCQTFLGLTVNCARCHDHKFDPISQQEYYRIASALNGVTQQTDERTNISAQPDRSPHDIRRQKRDQLLIRMGELEQTLRSRYSQSSNSSNTRLPIVTHGLQVLYAPDDDETDTEGKSDDPVRSGRSVLVDSSGTASPLHLIRQPSGFHATQEPAARLIQSLRMTNEFTCEICLTPANLSQQGPARILTISRDTGQRNFTVGQQADSFDIRLRTTKTDQNGIPSLTVSTGVGKPERIHLIVTLNRSGEMACYINGKRVAERKQVGQLSGWDDSYRMAIGNELSGDRPWQGSIDLVAFYSRALSPEEVTRHANANSHDLRQRQSVQEILVHATPQERAEWNALQTAIQNHSLQEPESAFAGIAHVVIPQEPGVTHVLARGNHRQPGEIVAPAGLGALARGGLSADFDLKPDSPDAQRRRALAFWISSPRNPLTARVIVNRLWHYQFGQGLVDTPSDFGFAGGHPSHPELLDWLAGRLIEGNWRIREIQRLIVTSATWRQASNVRNAPAQQQDADNRLLWRASSLRLDGESTRDSMLAVSGQLNRQQGGPSFRDVSVKTSGPNSEFTDPIDDFSAPFRRRTIYRLWARSGSSPLLESLDCADPSVAQPRRPQTITPVQSLALLNNRLVEHCAAALVSHVTHEVNSERSQQIDRMFFRVFGRHALPDELADCERLAARRGLQQVAVVLLNTNEFLFPE